MADILPFSYTYTRQFAGKVCGLTFLKNPSWVRQVLNQEAVSNLTRLYAYNTALKNPQISKDAKYKDIFNEVQRNLSGLLSALGAESDKEEEYFVEQQINGALCLREHSGDLVFSLREIAQKLKEIRQKEGGATRVRNILTAIMDEEEAPYRVELYELLYKYLKKNTGVLGMCHTLQDLEKVFRKNKKDGRLQDEVHMKYNLEQRLETFRFTDIDFIFKE